MVISDQKKPVIDIFSRVVQPKGRIVCVCHSAQQEGKSHINPLFTVDDNQR